MIRRGVMSIWKAILLVVGSLVGVAGATALGLYVAGGFDPKVVEPQDIYFSQQVEGQAYYLDGTNVSAEYKTSSDFYLTILSSTEDVTEKQVELSFDGQGTVSEDYIEDGVIKVPKKVSIGTPFKVELIKTYNSSIFADAVVGGTSILTAKSSNILLNSINARICVDVPVSEFRIAPTGEQVNETDTYVVYSDTEFSVSEFYKPTNSKYLFSDDEKSKLVFFDIQGENITYSYETQKFSAGQNGTGLITAYTFANSFYQRERLAQYGYTYEEMTPAIMENIKTTILADARLAANAPKYKSSSITVQISSATIDSISFVPAGSKYNSTNERFDAYSNKYLRLTTNSTYVGDATFGVAVTATAGQANTGALLSYMGIKIEENSGLEISGGRIAKVTKNSVTFENYDSAENYISNDDVAYYLLPNTSPQDYNNYYWQISSEKSGEQNLTINFFTKDENGVYTNYYEIDTFKEGLIEETEKTFGVLFAERENEEPPAWSDQETISMLINYDKDGNIIATSKDLSVDIQRTNNWKDNVYQEIRYFIFADNDTSAISSEEDLTRYFVCVPSGEYIYNYLGSGHPLVVNGTTARAENENYKLYEIPEGMLIATNSFSGEVKVFVATIQTRADGTPIIEEAKYKIVNTSYVRVVKVESTLSIKNIVSENTGVYLEGTETDDFIKDGSEYYIPASNKNVLNLKIALRLNGNGDAEKLLRAVNIGEAEGGIYFSCVDDSGDETKEYLTLENFAQDTTNSTEEFAIFNGMFAINQQLFEPDFATLDKGTKIRVKLSYNNGKGVQSEILVLFVGGEKVVVGDDEEVVDHFNIYYPQPTKIEWLSAEDTSLYDGGNVENALSPINVTIASSGQTIEWGSKTLSAESDKTAVEQLNELLQFKLFDQFNKEISQTSAGYQVLFVETPSLGGDKILNFTADGNAIASFSSAENQTTTMRAYVFRSRRDNIYEYDETGNVTANELKYTKTFTFVVTSEGVSKVEYDSTTTVNGSEVPASYEESENKGAVKIEKYIKYDNSGTNTINLASLIKVYVGSSSTMVSDLHFYFDNTFISSLSSARNSATGDNARESLLKMITIEGKDGESSVKSTDEGFTQIENWIGKRLTSFQFFTPFAQDTTIRLIAKDKDESLFNITIDLVCKPDVYLRNMIESKNTEWGYEDYLVEKDNTIPIFAGEKYKLDDIIPVFSLSGNNEQISWNSIVGQKFDTTSGLQIEDQVYVTDQTSIVSLINKEGEIAFDNIYLKINETKNFVTANISIFIHKTYYAYKINLRLYINPNIIVVSDEVRPTLNANDVFNESLREYYNIYKATDYIKNGSSSSEIDISDWTAENSSTSKYIALDLSVKKFKAEKATLELELGQTKNQDFALSFGPENSKRYIYGVKKYDSTIVKSDSNALVLTFDLGYQSEDKVIADAEIVKYKEKDYFIFISGQTYELSEGLAVYDRQVYGVVDVNNTDAAHKVVAKLNDGLISLNGNGFKAKKEISDGSNTLTIVSNINVVVFGSGDKFVYYNNNVLPDAYAEMKFNYYNDDTDFETLVASYYAENESHSRLGENGYTLLEENNVCQELVAGQTYKVLHKSKEKSGENEFADDFAEGDVYGFYYDSTLIDDSYNIDISIVGGATGYVSGLATYNAETKELSINHTESSLTDLYIVLRLSISKKNSTVAPFVCFYRIKVVPSFTLGGTNYPYAEDAEYLDEYSRGYYSNGAYTIDFSEKLNSTNSKYPDDKFRIEEASVQSNRYLKIEDVQFIADAGTDYYSDESLTNKENALSNSKILTKVDEKPYYTFIDGTTTYYVKAEDVKFYAKTNSKYYFDSEFKRQVGLVEEEKELNKDTNENYYFTTPFAPNATLSIKTAFINDQEIQSSEFSDYFEYNFVGDLLNITPVDDTTKLTIVVAKTLSLDDKALVGGENTYVLRFNQSKDYVANVTPSTGATITKVNEHNFSTTLKADGNETTFTVDLKERSANGTILSDVAEIGAYVKENYDDYFTFEFTEDKQIKITTESSITKDETFTIVVYTDTQIAFYIDLTIVGNYTITQNISEVNAGTSVGFDEILSIEGTHTIDFSSPDGTIIDNVNKEIQFSSLTEDRNIEFTITIDGTYSFNISLLVKANFEVKSRSYNNTTPQYGQKAFDIELSTIKSAFHEFNDENFFFVENGEKVNDTKITISDIPNVANSQTFYKTLTLGYYFNDSQVFTADVTYSYTVYKNVNVVAHYPSPAGTELSVEYVSTEETSGTYSRTIEDFFESKADFASQNRIVVENIPTGDSYDYTWRLAITSISNLEIEINGTNYTSQVEGLSATDNKYNIRFTLSNGFAEGTATFLVSVNEVETEYNIVVVQGNNFAITTNAPNYASVTDKENKTANAETIYAEDLANQEQTLFAENRILKYAFSSSVANGTTYYIKLEKAEANLAAMAKITSDGTTTTKNVDLGQSYAGYIYKGTYSSYNENTKTFVGNAIDDAQIYSIVPKLTRRVVATYRNGEEITNGLTLNVDEITLSETDFRKTKSTSITATINGSDKTTGISYNIYLDSYYSISGVVDSATSYTTITLNADYDATHVSTTLLTNSSLGISLTEAQMKQYGGSFSLLTYGFDDCPIIDYVKAGTSYYSVQECTGDVTGTIDEQTTVTKSGDNYVDSSNPARYFKASDVYTIATALHNYLTSTPDGEILYKTGLTPRAGVELDAGGSCGSATEADIKKNYITISGLQYNGKTYDYNISPQGANNDGNYVMMKLTYSITISAGRTINISNDILFKVLPSSNVSFKSGFGSSLYYSSTNITDENRTVATNQTTPYTIQSEGNEKIFYFNDSTTERAIRTLMYQNSTNTSNSFTYKFTGNGENWGSSPAGVVLNDKEVTVQPLVLGERTFYIDATNAFDYKIRFFFRVIAQTNPIVSEMSSSTLTEGDEIVIGAKYQTIVPTTTKIEEEDWATFKSFTYKKFDDDTAFANNLMLQGTYAKARIMFTHSDSKTYYKEWSDNAGSSVDVKTIVDSTEWTELDTENSQTFAETDLANKAITLYVKFTASPGEDPIAPFSAKYSSTNDSAALTSENSEEIAQLFTPDTTEQNPFNGVELGDTKSISLTGVKAYAIDKNAGAVSTASLEKYKSNVTKIKVKSIKFYYGDEQIGATGDNNVSLITSNQVSFYTDTGFENGTEYDSTLAFTIPTITNGYLFGTGNTISGVTMKITLIDSEENECEVSQVVTIQRNPNTKLEFANEAKVYDGDAPQVNTASGAVYNDTLEVELAPGATTTFTITTQDSSGKETTSTPITLTNPETYTVTRYIGIHANMSGISEIQTSFKVNVSNNYGATFYYNGHDVGENTYIEIDTYNSSTALNLHIASRRELSSNKKTVRLYFLLNEASAVTGGTKYQYIQDFEVSPEYLDTTYDSSILIVNDYYKISHGTDNFYVIPLASWAPNAKRDAQETTGTKIGTGDVPAYKFHFEIDTSLGGSAFIDENGTITTAANIDLQTEKIFINIYMKVSGTDGLFEDEDGILIETIVLALKPDATPTAHPDSEGAYNLDGDIVVVPTGYEGSASGNSNIGDVNTTIGEPTYAFSIDHTLTKKDFENMFSSEVDTWTNRNYHVVYTKHSDSDAGAYQYTNNLNSWTFPSVGKWIINVVVTGKNETTQTQTMLHKTLYIYDSNSSATEESWALGVNENIPDGFDNYKEIDSTTSELKTISKFAQANVYTKLYLNTEDGTLKTITWYVYGASDITKKVAVNVPTSSFRVSNVIGEAGATIYRYDETNHTMTRVTYETFNNSANTSSEIKYVSVAETAIKLYKITFYFTNSTTKGITDVVQTGSDQIANIKAIIADRLSTTQNPVTDTDITLYTILSNGELEDLDSLTPNSAYQTYSILAVVSGTTTRYYRYNVILYGYTEELTITHEYDAANSAYPLSNLNSEIATAISNLGDEVSDSTAKTYWIFTPGDITLTAITQEDLSETPTNPYTYYVRLGVDIESGIEIRYYKLSVAYTLETNS